MRAFFYKTLFLLGEDKKKIPLIIILFICSSSIELLGISLLVPYISIISDPLSLLTYKQYIPSYNFLPSNQNDFILFLSYCIISIFAFKMIVSILINNFIIKFGYNQQVKLSSKLLKVYQQMNYLNYVEKNSSEYVRDMSLLTEQYSTIIVVGALKTASELIVAIFMLSFLFYIDTFAFIALIFLVGIIVISYDLVIKKKIKIFSIESNKAYNNMIKNLNETMFSFKEARIFNFETFFHKRTIDSVRNYTDYRKKYKILQSIPKYLIEAFVVIFISSVIIIAIKNNTSITGIVSTIIAFAIVAIRLVPVSNILSSTIMQLRFANDAVSIMYFKLKEGENIKNKNVTYIEKNLGNFKDLTLKNVSFTFSKNSNKTLDKIDLYVKKGEMIGIIGESGSGKTTLIDLIIGFLTPDKGDIMFNGTNIADIRQTWNSCIAYLPQQPLLIDRSIQDNITIGHKNIDEKKLIEALQKSKLDKFIANLPNKIDTRIGENGGKISGGQKQRIALARSFYNEKQILILDEPTSALDNENEEAVFKELKSISRNSAIIIITHSNNFLEYFDRVYHISNGRLLTK